MRKVNNNYDVYMCRKQVNQRSLGSWLGRFAGMSEKEINDHLWASFAEKVSKNGFLKLPAKIKPQ
jgi:hypothetical protein